MLYNKSTPIIVIGSNGGTGAAIIDELITQEYTNIKVITISGKEKWGRDIEVIQADALNLQELLIATQGAQVIYGAFNASEYTDKSWKNEFPQFITNLIECGKANKAKLIFLDNVYSYVNLAGKLEYNENTTIFPTNTKGKIREQVASTFLEGLKTNNLQGLIIKSSDLYGPYALNSVIGDRFFEKIKKSNVSEIIPLGNNQHSMTYTRDVARIAVQILNQDNHPLIIHTPNDNAKGYQDMVRMTYKHFELTPKE